MKIDKLWLWVYRYVDGCGHRWIHMMELGLTWMDVDVSRKKGDEC
jgi:hypothetical protein